MSGIALSLVLMVVIPTIIGVFLNETSKGAVPKAVSPYLNPFSKICLLIVISANAAAAAPKVNLLDPKMLLIALLCVVMGVLAYLVAWPVGRVAKLNQKKQVSLFFAVGLRNISAATTIAIDFFPPAAAVPALLGIVFQQTLAAVMGRIMFKKTND
jgi:predicted Na+-dependent transporter